MDGEKLLFFLQDAAGMVESLDSTLRRLGDEPHDADLVHQAFRYVHSIKSEASFLGLEAIAAHAHDMESCLEPARSGAAEVDADFLDPLLRMNAGLKERIAELEREVGSDGGAGELAASEAAPHEASAPEAPPREASPRDLDLLLSEFQRKLLREASERGERLYRLSCEIAEAAPIKYAKAYLVVNNLEISANVIATVPPLDPVEDDERFRDFEVYFTASAELAALYDAVDVDQIARVSIAELGYDSLASRGSAPPAAERRRLPEEPYLRVPSEKYDEILEYAAEIRLLARSIPGSSALNELLPRFETVLKELRKVPLQRELKEIPRFARDLARSLGKRVQVRISGAENLVDRRLLDHLADPLLHLVRNAVDHGIESPEERARAGKPPVGTIFVNAARKDGQLVVQVADDGWGVDEEKVLARAEELGMARSDEDLLDILVRPGFSTREEASAVSGRGVGLDLVNQQVSRALGGELRMQTRKGGGTAFTLKVPEGSGFTSLLLARCGDASVGLQQRNIENKVGADAAVLRLDTAGLAWFEELPVYTVRDGLIRRLDRGERSDAERLVPAEGSLVVLNYLGRRVCLLADELLFERDFPDELIAAAKEAGPSQYKVTVESGLTFLLPAQSTFA